MTQNEDEIKIKKCLKCELFKPVTEFNKQTEPNVGYLSYCKSCASDYNKQWYKKNKGRLKKDREEIKDKKARSLFKQGVWRARKANRLPKSFDTTEILKEIEEIYKIAVNLTKETGVNHEVDHIIPLNHPEICGLHVPANLTIITDAENIIKMDTWDGTYDNEGWKDKAKLTTQYLMNKYKLNQ